MGALPSREATESPNTVYFVNNHGEVTFRLPLTPHYFPSEDCLAFRQLVEARNNQSGKYNFDVHDLEGFAEPADVQAFRAAQQEDWGPEANEVDPSIHYYDADGAGDSEPQQDQRDGGERRHLRPSIESAAALFDALVRAPTAHGRLVDRNAEMCAIYEQEQRWTRAQQLLSAFLKRKQEALERDQRHRDGEDGAWAAESTESPRDGGAGDEAARVAEALQVPPPKTFLTPIPEALVLQMTMTEVEEAVAAYHEAHGRIGQPQKGRDRQHGRPKGHADVDAGPRPTEVSSPAVPAKKRVGEDPDALEDQMNDTLDEEKLLSYPSFTNQTLPFLHDERYLDGRVHLVEHEGVNYVFAYNPAYVRRMGKALKVDASAVRPLLGSEAFKWRRSSLNPAGAGGEGGDGDLNSIFHVTHWEEVPSLFCWSNEAASHVPRAHFTTTYEVATRRPEDFGPGGVTADDADPNQRRAYELLSNVYEKFYIPVLPVKIIGMDGMLRTECDNVDAAVREVRERQKRLGIDEGAGGTPSATAVPHVPILKLCRFISTTHGEKSLNRLATLGILLHLERCLLAGLPDALVRPLRSTYALSDVPTLQFHREVSLRYMSASLEIGFRMMYVRESLERGERWNDFIRFVNSPMYGFRNPVAPEKVFRHQEILTGGAVVAAMESKMTVLKNVRKRPRRCAEDEEEKEEKEADEYLERLCRMLDEEPCSSDSDGGEACVSEGDGVTSGSKCGPSPSVRRKPRHEGSSQTEEETRGVGCEANSCRSVLSKASTATLASSVVCTSSCGVSNAEVQTEEASACRAVSPAPRYCLGPASRSSGSNSSHDLTSSPVTATNTTGTTTTTTTTTMQAMTPIFTEQRDGEGHIYKLARYCHHDFLLLRDITMLTRGMRTTVRGRYAMSEYTAEACRNISQALSRGAAPIISLPYVGRFPVAPNLVFGGSIPAASVPVPAAADSIRNVSVVVPTAAKAAATAPQPMPMGGSSGSARAGALCSPAPEVLLRADPDRPLRTPASARPTFLAHPTRRHAYACLPPPSPALQAEITAQYAKGLLPCFVVTKQQDNYFLNPHQADTTVPEVLAARAAPVAPVTAALAIQVETTYLWSHLFRIARAGGAAMRRRKDSTADARGKAAKRASKAAAALPRGKAGSANAKLLGRKAGQEKLFQREAAAAGEREDRFARADDDDGSGSGGLASPSGNDQPMRALDEPVPTFDGDVVVMCPGSPHWVPLRTFQQLVRLLLAEKNDLPVDGTDPIWRGVSDKAEAQYRRAVALAKQKAARQQELRTGVAVATFSTAPADIADPVGDAHDAAGDGEGGDDNEREPARDPRRTSVFDVCAGGHCCCVTGHHGKTPAEATCAGNGGGSGSGGDGRKAGATGQGRAEERKEADGASGHAETINGAVLAGSGPDGGTGGTAGGAVADSHLFPDVDYNKLFDPCFLRRMRCRIIGRLLQERERYGQDPFQLCRLESPVRFYGVYELIFGWTNSVMREERFEHKEHRGWLREFGSSATGGAGSRHDGEQERPPILQSAGFSIWSYTLKDGLGANEGAWVGSGVAAAFSHTREESKAAEEEEEEHMSHLPPFLRPFTNSLNKRLRFFLGTKPAFQRRQATRKRMSKRRKKEDKAPSTATAATPAISAASLASDSASTTLSSRHCPPRLGCSHVEGVVGAREEGNSGHGTGEERVVAGGGSDPSRWHGPQHPNEYQPSQQDRHHHQHHTPCHGHVSLPPPTCPAASRAVVRHNPYGSPVQPPEQQQVWQPSVLAAARDGASMRATTTTTTTRRRVVVVRLDEVARGEQSASSVADGNGHNSTTDGQDTALPKAYRGSSSSQFPVQPPPPFP